MVTSIQVSKITTQLLASLKEKSGKSYDKILREMLAKEGHRSYESGNVCQTIIIYGVARDHATADAQSR